MTTAPVSTARFPNLEAGARKNLARPLRRSVLPFSLLMFHNVGISYAVISTWRNYRPPDLNCSMLIGKFVGVLGHPSQPRRGGTFVPTAADRLPRAPSGAASTPLSLNRLKNIPLVVIYLDPPRCSFQSLSSQFKAFQSLSNQQ
jgi:hypothetical protein